MSAELIARLEVATLEDQATVLRAVLSHAWEEGWIDHDAALKAGAWADVGAYESAALVLVPPGVEYEISTLYGVAHVELPLNHEYPETVRRKDGNVALALALAVLRVPRGTAAKIEGKG
jgi:hypothetical protein